MSSHGTIDTPWLPRASCSASCVAADPARASRPTIVAARTTLRVLCAVLIFTAVPLLAIPMPGRSRVQRVYCRLMLRCLGVRITLSGGPIRNLSGVLVVSGHVSWVDVFVIGSVLPGSFVARADLADWPVLGVVTRLMRIIPIDRANLRRLPDVVRTVADRLRAGHTVVAFPEGTTWCGVGYGSFRPAMFQGAIDAGRPVQPLRLSYHHRDGAASTVPAFIGDDSLLTSIRRVITAQRTVAHVRVQSLQLPTGHRRDLALRCEAEVRGTGGPEAARRHSAGGHALVA
ncbi:lysophospholipid acyltransferase family protein [Mycolicibacterium sediminis]|uniref:1-acyl-sn-glycerol-3-phosphate acyltransferase n=1 Tax=Mycolicibacterium sediminis TaxID=1286180 RepID=A0A7I7QSF5_9MYCO|nr:lysophospholipid acyltransferase family protein [Mycolicibacterium sediminis]BBY29185.1 1-acyl-sn-glycerol-3-phosphate acyltransferase [Mycolicibacterium sediminis]